VRDEESRSRASILSSSGGGGEVGGRTHLARVFPRDSHGIAPFLEIAALSVSQFRTPRRKADNERMSCRDVRGASAGVSARAHYRCHLNRPYRVRGRRTQSSRASARARRPSSYSEECGYARTYMHAARRAGRDLRLGSPEIDGTLPIRREARRERHDLRAG